MSYPADNKPIFEEWFYKNISKGDLANKDRYYLPVFWTSYYVNNEYGNNLTALLELQEFINSLDKKKKYYTIVQYDDAILNDYSGIDLKVFGMSGRDIDYVLPLLCNPHKYKFDLPRDITANFIGKKTHPIRNEIFSKLSNNPKYYISEVKHGLDNYCKIMAKSIFTLCPRGYGQTSFRIMEALQQGSIPVYISDEFLIPHGIPFDEYGVLVKPNQDIEKILSSISQAEIRKKQDCIRQVYNSYFLFEANKRLILQKVRQKW